MGELGGEGAHTAGPRRWLGAAGAVLCYAATVFDDRGWAEELVVPWAQPEAWGLLAPEPSSRMDGARWAHQAERFFATSLTLSPDKRYPDGGWPLADRGRIELSCAGLASEVALRTLPIDRAAEVLRAAERGVAAIGGAGFDVLVRRGRRVWQIAAEPLSGDARGPLLLAAILASVLLAPVVPPDSSTIFGVKGARERLRKAGLGV